MPELAAEGALRETLGGKAERRIKMVDSLVGYILTFVVGALVGVFMVAESFDAYVKVNQVKSGYVVQYDATLYKLVEIE